jgi:predicted PurR-regulated permease PerM
MSSPPVWRLSPRTWVGLLALGLTLWLTITYARLILEVIWVLFGAFLLGLAIRPLADRLARWHIPRWVTVFGVYVALFGGAAILGDLLLPVISAEAAHLRSNGPTLLQTALSRLAAVPVLGQQLPSLDTLVQGLVQRLDTLLVSLVGAVTGLAGLALELLLVLILAFFFATDVGLGERLLSAVIPPVYQTRARRVMAHLHHRLTRWVWAQVAIALYFALIFSIGLTLLGVPFALTIGLVGGVLEIVPYLGGAVALALAVLSALSVSPWLALGVFVFYLVVVEVEAHIVAPAFYGRTIGLHPVVVLIALLVGAKSWGILGIFFAVPVTVVLAAILQEVRTVPETPDAEPRAEETSLAAHTAAYSKQQNTDGPE